MYYKKNYYMLANERKREFALKQHILAIKEGRVLPTYSQVAESGENEKIDHIAELTRLIQQTKNDERRRKWKNEQRNQKHL